jgi:hypothetical protein
VNCIACCEGAVHGSGCVSGETSGECHGRAEHDSILDFVHRWFHHLCSLYPQLDDEGRFPNVRKYNEGLSARPAFKKTFDS